MFRINFLIIAFSFMLYSEDTLIYNSQNIKVDANAINRNDEGFYSPNKYDIYPSKYEETGNISNVLSKESGIFIKDYGGVGGIKSVSIRGNAASQSAILYNGFKLNSAQNGMFDMSNFNSNAVDKISINKSNASILHGGNSAGGSINISNLLLFDRLSSSLELGSFDNKAISLNHSSELHSENIRYGISFNYRNALNNYPISFFDGNQEKSADRRNSASENFNFNAKISYPILGNYTVFEIGNWYNFREIPGPVISTSQQNSDASLSDNMFFVNSVTYNENYTIGLWFRQDKQNYEDDLRGEQNFGYSKSEFITDEFQYYFNYYFKLDNIALLLRSDGNITNLNGNMADPNARDNYRRDQIGLASTANYHILDSLNAISGFRLDYYSDVDNFISFSQEFNYNIYSFQLNTNFSRNYRPPAFNEMYYLNFGNLNLEPETSYNFDFGINFNYEFLDISSSVYYSEINNQIIAVPSSPILWSAQNADETINYGLESSFNLNFEPIELIFNYTRQISVDSETNLQVPYLPEEIFFTELSLDFWKIHFTISSEYSSFRYTIRNKNDEFLDNYLLFNSKIILNYSKYLIISFFANNLFNEKYEIINNFPMPGRNYNLRWSIDL